MRRDEAFPSKYLKSPDLQGKAVRVTIDRLEQTKNQQGEPMTLVFFRNKDKALILKPTTWGQIEAVTGEVDTDDWPGKTIILYPDFAEYNHTRFPVIRVRGELQVVEEEEELSF